jgi:hypothetical protein
VSAVSEPVALDDAPAAVVNLYMLLHRILKGHGARVEPVPLAGDDAGRLSTTWRVEMPSANPVLVTVSEP